MGGLLLIVCEVGSLKVMRSVGEIMSGWVNSVRVSNGMMSRVVILGYIIGFLVEKVQVADLAGAVYIMLL